MQGFKAARGNGERNDATRGGILQAPLLEVWVELALGFLVRVGDVHADRRFFPGDDAGFGHKDIVKCRGEYNDLGVFCPERLLQSFILMTFLAVDAYVVE